MPDPGMMLKDLDGYRGPSGRPWLAIVGVVTLVTFGGIWLARHLDRRAATEAAVDPAPAAARTDGAPESEVAATATAPNVPPSSEAARLLGEAQAHEVADRLLEARTQYLALLARNDGGSARALAESSLGKINLLLVTTPRAMPGKIDHVIRPGDSIQILARRHGCPSELIVKANAIANPNRIQVGDRIQILDKPAFAITVGKTRNDLLLTLSGAFFKRYTVGTGKFGRTPVGTFRIQEKIENPPWWRPDGQVVPFGDPENILGTRWLSLAATGETPAVRGYGIHGTWDNTSLGKQSSAGCIRMNNRDVEELFMLVPEGSPVKIVE